MTNKLTVDDVINMMKQMQDSGYAVAAFTPEEMGDIDPYRVEEAMIIAGNVHLELNNDKNEGQPC